jgi:hypothetical protein
MSPEMVVEYTTAFSAIDLQESKLLASKHDHPGG